MEYVPFEGDELARGSYEELIELARQDLERMNIVEPCEVRAGLVIRRTKAYPVLEISDQDRLETILSAGLGCPSATGRTTPWPGVSGGAGTDGLGAIRLLDGEHGRRRPRIGQERLIASVHVR